MQPVPKNYKIKDVARDIYYREEIEGIGQDSEDILQAAE